MIAIEDTNHCESRGEYETLDEAIAELRYLSSVPWDRLPNRCPAAHGESANALTN